MMLKISNNKMNAVLSIADAFIIIITIIIIIIIIGEIQILTYLRVPLWICVCVPLIYNFILKLL